MDCNSCAWAIDEGNGTFVCSYVNYPSEQADHDAANDHMDGKSSWCLLYAEAR